MEDLLHRMAETLTARVHGPLKFRFILQPLMALIFAVHAGMKDAREGRTPYFWAILSDPQNRKYLLKDGWKQVGKLFILALVLDAVYQGFVLHGFYPGEALLVAFVLALLPYLILRGLANRIFGQWKRRKEGMI